MKPATMMMQTSLAASVALAVCGCALGPVSERQRVEAAQDVPQDHPHPPPRLAGVPLDGSTDKLYCYNDGPDTICHRQSP
jgi:hypothetical protein